MQEERAGVSVGPCLKKKKVGRGENWHKGTDMGGLRQGLGLGGGEKRVWHEIGVGPGYRKGPE